MDLNPATSSGRVNEWESISTEAVDHHDGGGTLSEFNKVHNVELKVALYGTASG